MIVHCDSIEHLNDASVTVNLCKESSDDKAKDGAQVQWLREARTFQMSSTDHSHHDCALWNVIQAHTIFLIRWQKWQEYIDHHVQVVTDKHSTSRSDIVTVYHVSSTGMIRWLTGAEHICPSYCWHLQQTEESLNTSMPMIQLVTRYKLLRQQQSMFQPLCFAYCIIDWNDVTLIQQSRVGLHAVGIVSFMMICGWKHVQTNGHWICATNGFAAFPHHAPSKSFSKSLTWS